MKCQYTIEELAAIEDDTSIVEMLPEKFDAAHWLGIAASLARGLRHILESREL